ncbi:glycosyltransferase, partial [Klebsiella pneumoniae]|nr:glycosyltransferase family 1 protein [Klebsiella pneumoniae]HBR8063276.1 glycosyltransferase family 1 protein [Klebsiella pneumoniae]
MGKILLVCNDCPYPANHGGRLDILQRLKSLIELGESVDLIITHKESIANESKEYLESICENVYYIQRTSLPKAFIKSLLKFEPLQLTSRHALKNINLQGKYDTLI